MELFKKKLSSLLEQDFSKMTLEQLQKVMGLYRDCLTEIEMQPDKEAIELIEAVQQKIMQELGIRKFLLLEQKIRILLDLHPEAVLEFMCEQPLEVLVLLINELEKLQTSETQITLLLFAQAAIEEKAKGTPYLS